MLCVCMSRVRGAGNRLGELGWMLSGYKSRVLLRREDREGIPVAC
jgi:hypothetical protein